MRPAHLSIAALVLGATIAAAPISASAQTGDVQSVPSQGLKASEDGRGPGAGAETRLQATYTAVAARARVIVSAAERGIRRAYRQQPALMIGALGALLLPLLALAGYFVYRRRPEDLEQTQADADVMMPAAAAWIEIDGSTRVEMQQNRDFLQIGRQEDNDVWIADSSVHRYHAVIERSTGQGFVIVDVSGPDGNGVVVNGQRRIRAELADGDTVEVGRTRLRFQIAA